MRRRLVLRRGSLSVEQQHDTLPEPEHEAPSSEAERLEAEHVLVEPLHLVLLIGCVVQNGLEHVGEPEIFAHDANVLVLTQETATNPERASPVSSFGSSATTSAALGAGGQDKPPERGRGSRLPVACQGWMVSPPFRGRCPPPTNEVAHRKRAGSRGAAAPDLVPAVRRARARAVLTSPEGRPRFN